ncbi:hypothetical protein CVT26_004952 [Gymnopilus dilepis]|uniref:Amidase domain-containing protein n=1 Tax=Gymnopilus dilepis TaxID=231916 RepID=A0A409XZY5_9AGAR|nr:hypothetical protein CVT26_004952 [Gymnopilus dilepis]
MWFFTRESLHHQACARKQAERRRKIESLSSDYSCSPSVLEAKIHSLSISDLVTECHSGSLQPTSVLKVYAKKALQCHKATNCIADVMFEEASAVASNWDANSCTRQQEDIDRDTMQRAPSLMGVPISIKGKNLSNVHILWTFLAMTLLNVGLPARTSSAMVRLLQDTGALLHVKTTVPTGLLSLETMSDLFGRTTNPYDNGRTAGASTGGGAALVAGGGSKIEIGTDIAGSVRIPAHFCGLWSLKSSSGRFPAWGNRTSMPGLDSIPLVVSPLAGSLCDLREFCERVIQANPWRYDHTCVPLPWRTVNLQENGRKLKVGVIWDDGVIPPTPACKRALLMAVAALEKQGHEIFDFSPPKIHEGLQIGYQLLFSDGGLQITTALQQGEAVSPATKAILDLMSLPRPIKKILSCFIHSNDPLSSQLYDTLHAKTALQDRENVVARDLYRAEWHRRWTELGLDFILTVPIAFPAPANNESVKTTLMSAGYTFLFNLAMTHVDRSQDQLPENFFVTEQYKRLSLAGKGAYSVYDANKMHGLPVGIQVVGKKLEEEKVLEGMRIIENALRDIGTVFVNKTVY